MSISIIRPGVIVGIGPISASPQEYGGACGTKSFQSALTVVQEL